jgi:hypothetical protein
MKKSKGNNPPKAPAKIPTKVMAGFRHTFQKQSAPDSACPEPEQVISSALAELAGAEQQEVQRHLLTCRNCLDLYLDVRLAHSEAASPAGEGLEELPDDELTKSGWLAALARKAREALQALGRPRRLIPAVAAVSLTVFLIVLGSREFFRVAPHPQLALKQQESQARLRSATPPQEPVAVKPHPAPPAPEILASKPLAGKTAGFREKARRAGSAVSGPIHAHLSEIPADGGRITFSADQKAFAYLLRQDRTGKVDLLYSGSLEAGKDYSYPVKNHLLQADIDTGAAGATIFLVASPTPIADLATRIKELERLGQDEMPLLFPEATIRSLSINLP